MLNVSFVNRSGFWLGIIIVVGVLLRALAVMFLDIVPISDFAHYQNMATTMVASGDMRDNHGNMAFYSAGYPLFLSPLIMLFGQLPEPAQWANVALGGLSIWLVWLCTREVVKDWRWAALAAAAWAFYPPPILYSEYLAKENLMVPLLLLQTLMILRFDPTKSVLWQGLRLGLLFGASLLVGPAIVLTAGIMVLVILWPHAGVSRWRGWATLAAIVFGTILILSPWLAYTNARLGEPVLATNGSFNLYLGNNPNNLTPYYQGIETTPIAPEWRSIRNGMGEIGAMAELGNRARAYMLEDIIQTMTRGMEKIAAFWYPPVHSGRNGDQSRLETLMRQAWLFGYLLLSFMTLLPILRWRDLSREQIILYGMVLSYCAIHAFAYVIFRYRIPVMPLVTVLAFSGVAMWFPATRRSREPLKSIV